MLGLVVVTGRRRDSGIVALCFLGALMIVRSR